ncbi:NUDIX domain-containing protein [Microaerobacter geothermalis]|uniref:NUDIX hydrolase n=1 Tax=Microaerobacter geothermalis TaxID=674972 RepID=UPI001F4532B8|nr:NUDIX domain-containing protein [Microaerobacter geothermalis]MCF6092857.1 NUDIX domain-containing protein [Microaerobacter geothermalis]
MKEISAGGVVYKKDKNNKIWIMLIEDRYSRISLAKGKQEPGETLEETALRETKEETGITGKIIKPLEVIYYQYYHPKIDQIINKEVHYFLIEGLEGVLQPQLEEIKGVKWVDPSEVWKIQKESGYENNDLVIKKALQELGFQI